MKKKHSYLAAILIIGYLLLILLGYILLIKLKN